VEFVQISEDNVSTIEGAELALLYDLERLQVLAEILV
jgi:hypothetical protein